MIRNGRISHRPEVMGRWGTLLAEVRRPVDDCRFELGTDTVVAIADGRELEVLSDENVSIVRFARGTAHCFFTKILDALGSEPDVGLMEINPELSQHLLG